MTYDIILFLHVIGSTVLLGTGAGIAFFMVSSNRTKNPALSHMFPGLLFLPIQCSRQLPPCFSPLPD